VLAECRVPQWLEPLQDGLLDHAVDRARNAEVARPAGRLGDFHPSNRLRLVAPLEQLPFDLRPARRENSRQLLDGDPVNTGCPLVAGPKRCFHVVRCTDLLHESVAHCRAFGAGHRPDHFSLSRGPVRGFTPLRHRQLELIWRLRCAHETPDLLALSFNPFRGPFRPSAGGPAYYAFC
jgi:hypothetical protein